MTSRFHWKGVGWWMAIAVLVIGCAGAAAVLAQRRQRAGLAREADRANLRFPLGIESNPEFALDPELQCFRLPSDFHLVGQPIDENETRELSGVIPWSAMKARMQSGDQIYQYSQSAPAPKGTVAFMGASGGYLVLRGRCLVGVAASWINCPGGVADRHQTAGTMPIPRAKVSENAR